MNVTTTLSPEAVEAVATRAAEIVLERLRSEPQDRRWLYGDRALAAYLSWPLGRVQKLRGLPCHRIGQRKAYRTDEIDAWLREQ